MKRQRFSSIWLMGPTASGKTDLAIELVKHFPCEIISVDSALIYKDMNIGTAKPSADELKQAPHFLIDFLDPAQSYSVAQFRRDALRLMAEIAARDNIPLLVGGTMMYFRALEFGLSDLPTTTPEVREKIADNANTLGWQAMHDKLKAIDPKAAARIHVNDPQRLSRALEVYEMTGQSLSHLQQTQKNTAKLPYAIHKFAIAPQSRELLRERIALRFDAMLNAGFEAEVTMLKARGDLHLDLPSMRCVGYRQMWQYLNGEIDDKTMREKAITATRQLAKRQMTWLRSEQNVEWLETDNLTQQAQMFDTLKSTLRLQN